MDRMLWIMVFYGIFSIPVNAQEWNPAADLNHDNVVDSLDLMIFMKSWHSSNPLTEIVVPIPNLPVNAKPLEMVLIPAGTFTMGSSDWEIHELNEYMGNQLYNHERPQHQVTITKSFYLGKYEVTQAQFLAIIDHPLGNWIIVRYGQGNNYPVYQVTWYECAAFCNRLSEREGLTPVYNESTWAANLNANGYRLPTEAEWEYACRAGTTTRFSHGDVVECFDFARECSTHNHFMWWFGNDHPYGCKEVGQKLPNPWGLYDMHGNMGEWCQDWYGAYPSEPQTNPQGSLIGDDRVLRDGSFESLAPYCRSANRTYFNPDYKGYDSGFRIARTK